MLPNAMEGMTPFGGYSRVRIHRVNTVFVVIEYVQIARGLEPENVEDVVVLLV